MGIEKIVAVVGLLAAVVFGVTQCRSEAESGETVDNRSAETLELLAMTAIAPLFPKLDDCSEEGDEARKISIVIVNHVANEYGKSSLAGIVSELSGTCISAGSIDDLKLSESAVDAGSGGFKYFSVIASLPGDDLEAAKNRARELKKLLDENSLPTNVSIYKTKISSSFAVVIGKKTSYSAAENNSKLMRNSGVVPDAFTQIDKQWKFIDSL